MFNNSNNSNSKKTGQKLTNHARRAFLRAEDLARKLASGEITAIHLLYSIYLEKGSLGGNILNNLGLKNSDFQKILQVGSPQPKFLQYSSLSPSAELKKVFTRAYSLAKEFNFSYVGTEHLVYALFDSGSETIKKIIARKEIERARRDAKAHISSGNFSALAKILNLPELALAKNQPDSKSATAFIDKFCVNINKETTTKKEIVIGREKEIGRIINILGRKNKNNPLLIGDPGVGKTVLVSGLAQLINSGQVPASLYRKRIMNLDVAQLIAGTSFRGEFEARLKEIIGEASANQDVILFIDEIHNIVGAGNVSGSLDLANILKPALARGDLRLIGATTAAEYKKYIEKDAALERRFQPVEIKEPSKEEAKKILFGIKGYYENFHNVSLDDEAVNLAVELSIRYIQNRFLPDKAIDVIDEASSQIRSQNNPPWRTDFLKQIRGFEDQKLSLLEQKEKLVSAENFEEAIALRTREKELSEKIGALQKSQAASEKENRIRITAADIIETVARISGIPAEKLSEERGSRIKNIRKILSAQIIGQKEAIENLTGVLLRAQTGIGNPDRPLGSFLFLGPTGVGKTLTAKILAQEFFGPSGGGGESYIRIDMSELMERHSVASLIGSPAGYVGFGEGGNLTEKIRRNPYSVVLFDEIEKAHPDVFNILLQILEDGTLTDAEGTTVSFKNTIVILTSNIGTGEFTSAARVGFEDEKSAASRIERFNTIKGQVLKELEQKIRPELLNRLDYTVVFNALGMPEIQKIAGLEMQKLAARLLTKGIELSFGKDVLKFIARKSLAVNQGARLVRKNIQELLENRIAEMIIYDKVVDNKITVSIEKDKIKIA
ncbi:MAG: ATP-dependent Clp protease ATP-binding subunit [Parcubacteria group bacterium]